MRKSIVLALIAVFILSDSCAKKKENDTIVRFETNQGNILVRLYPQTVKHRTNFLKLVNVGFYSGVLFHRVINGFMIQGGDPDSKTAKPNALLGSGDVGYTIPAEFVYPQYYHKRGVLAAAREGDQLNPTKASSGCQFYIVVGKKFTDSQLDSIEQVREKRFEVKLFQEIANSKQNEIQKIQLEQNQSKLNTLRDSILNEVHKRMKAHPSYKLTPQQRKDYKTTGGTPHLDGEYTVFGQVIEGMEVVDLISTVKTGTNNRPLKDVRIIKAEVVR